ncbi:MAG: hypothetical protein IPJ83_16525 [Saprospiraceae bacterium]|nr:hypothetical protein [Candidatus Vicinibacter proximus]
MKFKVEESFKIRHKLLEYLFNEQEKLSKTDFNKRFGSIDLHTKLNIPIEKIHRYHEILKKDDEIDCCETDGQHKMFIKEKGRYAYLEKKYLKQGWFELWEHWFQPLKVIVPFIAVSVSVFAIIYNKKQSNKVEALGKKIDQIELRIEAKNK